MNNDETICMNQNAKNENQDNVPAVSEKEKNTSWKKVAIGGAAGILMGAGAIYATDALAGEQSTEESKATTNTEPSAASGASHDVTHHVTDNGLKVAEVSDDMSFGEAFAAAREEVGAGGVFQWKGNLYNTYTEEEWDAMSASEKAEFAQLVEPELPGADVANAAAAPEVNDTAAVTPEESKETADNNTSTDPSTEEAVSQTVSDDPNVSIVGTEEVDGHTAVIVDLDNDRQGDVAVIDVDDSGSLTSPDVVVDAQGNAATVGELENGNTTDPTFASTDSDVAIVGTGDVEGHTAVVVDVDSDQQGDVAVIDVDDSSSLTSPDVIVDNQGNMATVGEVTGEMPETDYTAQQYGMETPEPDTSADMMMYDV